jgi:hypothetical protein
VAPCVSDCFLWTVRNCNYVHVFLILKETLEAASDELLAIRKNDCDHTPRVCGDCVRSTGKTRSVRPWLPAELGTRGPDRIKPLVASGLLTSFGPLNQRARY